MAVMNLYCAGGASTNIGGRLSRFHQKRDTGFAELNTYFIDTSKSNLNPNIPSESVYLVDGVDGSGKKRSSNYEALVECTQEILHKFKPAAVNVILHSAGGGTGSTVGPILVSELLARQETVIVVMIGSTSSRIETENTAKTLRSYEIISQKREMPVVAFYRENSADTPRSSVDDDVEMAITMIAAIFSGDNRELDSSDLKNFVNYHNVTSYHPKLALLEFFSGSFDVGKNQSLVSLVTLVDETTASDVAHKVEYQTVGYVSEVVKENLNNVTLPIHGAVITGYFNSVVDSLDHRSKEFDELRKVVVEKSIVNSNTKSTDIGVVL